MANFDDLKLAVEALSGGKNTVLLDDIGLPSIMVVWPKQKNKDLFGGADTVHPGSIIDGVEKTFYVSKFQNVVYSDRAYSLPARDPKTSINFDTAVSVCRKKGKGWGLMPYSLWCQIALWCRKNETMPRGNNNFGSDHSKPHEKGVETCKVGGSDANKDKTARTATGSGPATWNHNWLPDGIADMNGNVWEWTAGLRLKDGEINIIPYADSMLPEVSLGADSTRWKAINAQGEIIKPGAAGSLKWDWVSPNVQLTDKAVTFVEDSGHGAEYKNMTLVSDLTAPELAKALLLYPDEPDGDYGGDWHYLNTRGERLALCGGGWFSAGGAGVFGVDLNALRTRAYGNFGFRSAFCQL